MIRTLMWYHLGLSSGWNPTVAFFVLTTISFILRQDTSYIVKYLRKLFRISSWCTVVSQSSPRYTCASFLIHATTSWKRKRQVLVEETVEAILIWALDYCPLISGVVMDMVIVNTIGRLSRWKVSCVAQNNHIRLDATWVTNFVRRSVCSTKRINC